MIKKLRIRFVCVAMAAVVLVLGLMLFVINITNFQNVIKNADNALLRISEMNAETFVVNENPAPQHEPMRERFFVASIDADGNLSVDLTHLEWITEDEAKQIAQQAFTLNQENGTVNDFRFLVSSDKKTAWLLDLKNEFENSNNFLKNSLIVGAVGIVFVFVLVVVFSRFVLKPVEQSYKKQKEFITNAAHELKTPLTVISLNNELCEMKFGKNENAEIISMQIKKLKVMVQNLLTLSRIDEQVLQPKKEKLDFSNLCENSLKEFEEVLKADGKTFEKKIEKECFILGDETFLKQLLSIFLENACKYAENKTVFEVFKENKKIILRILNDTKMEDGNMEKCFDRFYRSEDARASNIEGSGIGLSVAKELSILVGVKLNAFVKDKMFVIELELKQA